MAWSWGRRERRTERHGHRVTYSRWDGTQKAFELTADDIFGEITDDLLYHGDLNAWHVTCRDRWPDVTRTCARLVREPSEIGMPPPSVA